MMNNDRIICKLFSLRNNVDGYVGQRDGCDYERVAWGILVVELFSFDCGGGYTKLHMTNLIELLMNTHRYTHKWVHVKLVKSE